MGWSVVVLIGCLDLAGTALTGAWFRSLTASIVPVGWKANWPFWEGCGTGGIALWGVDDWGICPNPGNCWNGDPGLKMGWGWNLFKLTVLAGGWNPGAVIESIWGWNLGTDDWAGLAGRINSLGSKRTTGC